MLAISAGWSCYRHTHDGYVIGVIEWGWGQIVVINPDEVHTGHSGSEKGWTYRMMYPDADILKKLLEMAAGRALMPGDFVTSATLLAQIGSGLRCPAPPAPCQTALRTVKNPGTPLRQRG